MFTGRMDGFWTGHLWTRKGNALAPSLLFGLTQLKIDFDSSDEQALGGYAITFLDKYAVQGNRRVADGAEEFDVLLRRPKMNGLSIRLIGRYVAKDETLEGNWMIIRRDEVGNSYGDRLFSLQPPQQDQPFPLTLTDQEDASIRTPRVDLESGPVETPGVRIFVFQRTPVEVAGFCRLPEEGMKYNANSRWRFLRDAVLHLVRSQLWSQNKIVSWSADRHKFLDLFTRQRLRRQGFSIPNPLGPEEQLEF
ncbi:hypothetical protein D9756_010781 [Leucocoprinus leucothites]|uniref:Uncharacterized protein n=1 Tax=Leucocoprinus leucothites TaxID=201217 RepID=A0A8H5CW43_9AGAR|nr:hypothetical protein D9756_010781 [Leucoagaricus leucothites]